MKQIGHNSVANIHTWFVSIPNRDGLWVFVANPCLVIPGIKCEISNSIMTLALLDCNLLGNTVRVIFGYTRQFIAKYQVKLKFHYNIFSEIYSVTAVPLDIFMQTLQCKFGYNRNSTAISSVKLQCNHEYTFQVWRLSVVLIEFSLQIF